MSNRQRVVHQFEKCQADNNFIETFQTDALPGNGKKQ